MIHERVDDVPLLMAEIRRLGVTELLDAHFPTHGNWDGMSLGEVVAVWLTHILSEANHCLSHVQPWARTVWRTLAGGLGGAFRLEDLSDERLAATLRYLAKPEWAAFEAALTARSLRVYDLEAKRVRLDSTTVSSHQAVTPTGLFQFGHSKDARQDLPILKVMSATLDPLGLPLATTVLAGNHADDPLYVPAIQAVQQGLKRHGVLYVGDSKMGALETRAWVEQQTDYYLCPLGGKQLSAAELDALLLPVWSGEQTVASLAWTGADGKRQVIATGFEVTAALERELDGQTVAWNERRLVIRSGLWAEQLRTHLRERLAKAQAEITELGVRRRGKRRILDLPALTAAVEQIQARHQVTGLLQLHYQETRHTRTVRGRGQAGAPEEVTVEVSVTAEIDPVAQAAVERRLGWRVYATNAPQDELSLEAATGAYREQYQIEHSYGRLKGKPLSLQPMYLSRDDHATGLVRLLSLALRVLPLVEFQVRRRLAARNEPLRGLYPGQPRRATLRPSTELLLRCMRGVTLTIQELPDRTVRYLTPLTPLQQEILTLLQLPATIYTGLVDRREEPG